jgi:hypothetical protein
MDRRARFGFAILVLLAGSACSNGVDQAQASLTPTSAVASTTPAAASPSPAPDPVVSCSATPIFADEPLLLASTPGSDKVLLEGLADPAHPTTYCTLSGAEFRIFSPSEIGYVTTSSPNDPIHGTSVIGRINLGDLKPVALFSMRGEVLDLAWSLQGSRFAYLVSSDDPATGAVNVVWLSSQGDPPRIAAQIPLYGRGGSLDDETIVRFSADGQYLFMVDTFVAGAAPASASQAVMQVWSAAGVDAPALAWVPPSALEVSGSKSGPYITMAVWSHASNRLYYRDKVGVQTWEPQGLPVTFDPGVQWRWPSLSGNDSQLAYELTVNGESEVHVRDLISGSVQVFKGERRPILLSTSEMIEEHTDGGWYVQSLPSGVETPRPEVAQLMDTWPH